MGKSAVFRNKLENQENAVFRKNGKSGKQVQFSEKNVGCNNIFKLETGK